MAPGFLVARLGAVDVAAAAALMSTLLLWLTVTTDVTCVWRGRALLCGHPSRPLSPPLVPLSGSHSPFWSRRGGDIHAAFVWQAWHRWYWAGSGGALGRV